MYCRFYLQCFRAFLKFCLFIHADDTDADDTVMYSYSLNRLLYICDFRTTYRGCQNTHLDYTLEFYFLSLAWNYISSLLVFLLPFGLPRRMKRFVIFRPRCSGSTNVVRFLPRTFLSTSLCDIDIGHLGICYFLSKSSTMFLGFFLFVIRMTTILLLPDSDEQNMKLRWWNFLKSK